MLGAWYALGEAEIRLLLMVKRATGWHGSLVTQKPEGRTKMPVTALLSFEAEEVETLCGAIMEEFLLDGRCDRMVYVEVKDTDRKLIERRLRLIPWIAV